MNSVHELSLETRVCGRNSVKLRLRPSLQNLLRSLRQREIGGAKLRRVWIVSISGAHEHCFLEGVKQCLRVCLYVLAFHSKSISFQVVSRFCFMADLVRNEEVLRTLSLAAAF